jgi:hypothetical protein
MASVMRVRWVPKQKTSTRPNNRPAGPADTRAAEWANCRRAREYSVIEPDTSRISTILRRWTRRSRQHCSIISPWVRKPWRIVRRRSG